MKIDQIPCFEQGGEGANIKKCNYTTYREGMLVSIQCELKKCPPFINVHVSV